MKADEIRALHLKHHPVHVRRILTRQAQGRIFQAYHTVHCCMFVIPVRSHA